MKTLLVIGNCGSGKTWVMRQLIKQLKAAKKCKVGKVVFQLGNNIAVLGNYDGSTFEGSDKLSMAVMSDCDALKAVQLKNKLTIICEGDRFTNSTFINKFTPIIIKIKDSGVKGRELRATSQSERHLKSIATRVSRIKANYEVDDSNEALRIIEKIINEKN